MKVEDLFILYIFCHSSKKNKAEVIYIVILLSQTLYLNLNLQPLEKLFLAYGSRPNLCLIYLQGCDASVLLPAELEDRPNKNSLRGLEAINDVKQALEAECPQYSLLCRHSGFGGSACHCPGNDWYAKK